MDTAEQSIVVAEPAPSREASILQAIVAAATDHRTDIAKMRELMAMAKEIRAEQAKAAYADAMSRFQRLKQTIATNRKGTAPGGGIFDYADWPQMEKEMRLWLAECDLTLTHRQTPTVMEKGVPTSTIVYAILRHRDGYAEEVSYPAVPNPLVAAKLSPLQAFQQGVTYAKRQSAALILGIATAEDRQDDDANKPDPALTDKQLSTLVDLIAAWDPSAEDRARFFAWARVSALEEISSKAFPGCVSALRKKVAQKAPA